MVLVPGQAAIPEPENGTTFHTFLLKTIILIKEYRNTGRRLMVDLNFLKLLGLKELPQEART